MEGGVDIEETKTCWPEFATISLRLVTALAAVIVAAWTLLSSNQSIMTDRILVLTPRPPWDYGDIDVTFCPVPSANHFSMLEMGGGIQRLYEHSELTSYLRNRNRLFKWMIHCVESKKMKIQGVPDIIKTATQIGCLDYYNKRFRYRLTKAKILDYVYGSGIFYWWVKRRLGIRADELGLWRNSDLMNNDNLTMVDTFNMVAINASDFIRLREQSWETTKIGLKNVPTRLAMQCAQYHVPLKHLHSSQRRRLTFDFVTPNCSLLDQDGRRRRWGYCGTPAHVLMKVFVTRSGGFSDAPMLQDHPAIPIALDRNIVINTNPSRTHYMDNGRCFPEAGTHMKCVKEKLISALMEKLTCYVPWLSDVLESSIDANVTLPPCTDIDSLQALLDTLRVMDGETASDIISNCSKDCMQLDIRTTLLGNTKLAANERYGNLIIYLNSEAPLYTEAYLTTWSIPTVYALAMLYFFTGVSLLSAKRWFVELLLWVGGARKYLRAALPFTTHDLHLRRARRRMGKLLQRRRWWTPNSERPWLKRTAWYPPSWVLQRLWALSRIRHPDWWRSEHMRMLDTESETDDSAAYSEPDLPKKISYMEITKAVLCPFGYESSTDSDIPEYDPTRDWMNSIRCPGRRISKAARKRVEVLHDGQGDGEYSSHTDDDWEPQRGPTPGSSWAVTPGFPRPSQWRGRACTDSIGSSQAGVHGELPATVPPRQLQGHGGSSATERRAVASRRDRESGAATGGGKPMLLGAGGLNITRQPSSVRLGAGLPSL